MDNVAHNLNIFPALGANEISLAFAVVANLAMGVLLYISLYYWVDVRIKQRKIRSDYRRLKSGVKPSELCEGLFNDVMLKIINRHTDSISAESVLREQFSPLLLRLNYLKELGSTAGMLFTVLSIILFGFTMSDSSTDAMMKIFTTALSTTAIGAVVSIITSHVLVRLKVMVLEASVIVEEADLVRLGLKRKRLKATRKYATTDGKL